jgi:divalent metal cation (Fe/Co/Zn/Cd) transporter
VRADSTQTLLCAYLSAALLAGLVVNATMGWSWPDPIAALEIAAVAGREGVRYGGEKAATARRQAPRTLAAPRIAARKSDA